ncbi:MAG: HAD-IC family P-type ATPase [Firmicutes bacterium]|nr:HAD-IC family P-type ATPase [Bacillota bacterium]
MSETILKGLTKAEVEERIKEGKVNLTVGGTKSVKRIILEHSLTLFNLLNVFLAALVVLVGSYKNMLFMGVVISNTVIGIVQEIRSKRMVDSLSIMVSSKIETVRDGVICELPSEELVADDLIHLSRGAQIPADAVVVQGTVSVNESLLSGEPDLIEKKEGAELFSGSFIASGTCYARLIRVGKEAYASKINQEAKTVKKAESEIMHTLKRIVRIISCVLVPLGIILYLNQLSLPDATVKSAVVGTVAALISMIPEGLMLLTSSVLAVAVIRLSRRNVLVQQLYCIETLARVDVICLDKTGTITSGRMQVSSLLGFDGVSAKELSEDLRLIGTLSTDESPTIDAIRASFGTAAGQKAARFVPFSSERKWSGVTLENGTTLIMGAGEMVLPDQFAVLEKRLSEKIGTDRALVIARSEKPLEEEKLPSDLTGIGMVLIRDEIRPEAPDTIAYFKREGVDLRVISGDSVGTVSHIAMKAGIDGAEKAIDMRNVATAAEMEEAAASYKVFGRVSPEQKRQLVRALQRQGHTVAMTGDGVNDVLAMKESDCSVAMASGSEAARSIAQLVLTKDDFSSMPDVVAEGRRSINNIQRSASMFLTKTIFAILLGLVFAMVNLRYPFQPIQMSFVSSLTIGLPSLILALQPNHERISGNFFYNIVTRAVSGGVSMAISVLLAYAAGSIFHLAYEEISFMAVMLTCLVGICLLYRISIPFDTIRICLFVLVVACVILGTWLFGDLFNFPPLTWPLLGMIAAIGAVTGTIFFLLFSLMEKYRLKTLSPESVARSREKNRQRQEEKALHRAKRLAEWENTSGVYRFLVRFIAVPIFWVQHIKRKFIK